MSYRSVIEHALRVYYADAAEPNAIARELLAKYDTERPGREAYPGELDMLRGLIATMHAVAEHGDLGDVRKLLAEHQADDQAARAERPKHSSTPAARPPAGPTGRVAQLLDAIRTARGEWPVHRAVAFYRENVPALRSMPHRHLRTVARGDLRDLTAWGHLQRHEGDGTRRFYTLKTRKDDA
ncbi:DNA binding protein [Streptomyces phage OnionKnight]|nr:DNA binding protein [Streptomyces phage OnionKnight]